MASKQEEEELAFSAAYEDDTPTPSGWKRKLVPRIGKGLMPARTDVIFITPDGEEFTSRAQLQRYLKANKGSPSLSEFIWIVDEIPRRSTRSKSTPLVEVKKVDLPLKVASKRKPATEAAVEVEPSKRKRTEKLQKPVELPVVKGRRTKQVAHTVSPAEEKREDQAFTGSTTPVSPKKKRSVKNVKKTSTVPAETKTLETNGEADSGKKDEVVDEVVEKLVSPKASKKKPTKARTTRGGRKRGNKKGASDDTKRDAEGGNGVDESSPLEEVAKAESDAGLGETDNHNAEKDCSDVTAHNNEEEAVVDQANHS